MNNYERYEKKLTEIFRSGRQFGVNKATGEPLPCDFMPCQNCAFNEIKEGCTECRVDWMDKKEVPVLQQDKEVPVLQQDKSVANDEAIMEAINYAADKCRLVESCEDCPYMALAKFPNCRTLYVMDYLVNQGLIDITAEAEEQTLELHTTDGRVEKVTLPSDEDDDHSQIPIYCIIV